MRVSTPQLPADPNIANETLQAQNDKITALSAEAQGDTASIMARYGTRLAMAGVANTSAPAVSSGMSPLAGKF